MEWFLILIFICIIVLIYIFKKSIFDVNILIMGPYILIIVINNWIATNFGYQEILPEVIIIIASAVLFFYFGTIVGGSLIQKIGIRRRKFKQCSILNMKRIEYYVVFVLVIRFFDLVYKYIVNGFNFMISNDFEAMQMTGIVAHLFLSIYPLLAVLFYKGLKGKNKTYIVLVCLGVLLTFASFIKYHTISLVLIIYLYTSIKDKKYLLKGARLVMIGIIAIFVLNYFVSFVLRSLDVDNSFYIYHLWTYIAGGSINFNWLVQGGVSNKYDIIDLLIKIFMAFPNMFINKITGISIIGNDVGMGFQNICASNSGMSFLRSNVINTIAQVYAINNKLLFVIIMYCWGFMSEFIFNLGMRRKEESYKLFAATFISFNLLSFFANYFALSVPMELLIWSCFITRIFKVKNKRQYKL